MWKESQEMIKNAANFLKVI